MFVLYLISIVACVVVGYSLGMRIWNRVRAQQQKTDDDINYAQVDEEFYKDWPSVFEHDSTHVVTDDAPANISDVNVPSMKAIAAYEHARKTQQQLKEKTKRKPRKKSAVKKSSSKKAKKLAKEKKS
jgi:hypothetical protein